MRDDESNAVALAEIRMRLQSIDEKLTALGEDKRELSARLDGVDSEVHGLKLELARLKTIGIFAGLGAVGGGGALGAVLKLLAGG